VSARTDAHPRVCVTTGLISFACLLINKKPLCVRARVQLTLVLLLLLAAATTTTTTTVTDPTATSVDQRFFRSTSQPSSKALSYCCVPTEHRPPIHALPAVIVPYNAKIGCYYVCPSATCHDQCLHHCSVLPPDGQSVEETNSDVINLAVVCFCGHVAHSVGRQLMQIVA
jgi:hypothetical protein